jgi:acyl carrier protein
MQNHVITSPTFVRRAAGILPGVKLFDSLFIWQESTVSGDSNGIQVLDSEDRLEFGLVLEFEPSPSVIKARATYRQSLMDEEQIDAMLHQVDLLASQLIESATSLVETLGSCSDLDVLSISPKESTHCDGTLQLPTTGAFVLSTDGSPRVLPAGAYGEVAFRIEQIESENLDTSNLDTSNLVEHPDHGRLYRSGDAGRISANGTLLIAGKLEDQVFVNGSRIDLAEINVALAQHPNVSKCATLVFGEEIAKPVLVSFWVPASSQSDSSATGTVLKAQEGVVSSLFDHLEDTLQRIPSTLLPLRELPVTQQGKLDKQSLQGIFDGLQSNEREIFSRSYETASTDAPISSQEQTVAECLAETLGISMANISRLSSFSSLGWQSQDTKDLATTLEKRLNVPVDTTKISGDVTIAQLCRALASTRDSSESATDTNPAPRTRGSASIDGPSSTEERAIAAALAEILDLPLKRISRNSSFFALGLNSLNAIQLVRSLKKRLDAQISVSTILSHPSVARLCRAILDVQSKSEQPKATEARRIIPEEVLKEVEKATAMDSHDVEAVLPCTPLQQAMLSATSSMDGDTYCNTLKLRTFPDVEKFAKCWKEMTKRHEILRTFFVETSSAAHPYAQVVLKEQPSSWTCFDNKTNGHRLNGDVGNRVEDKISSRTPLRFDKRGSDLYLRMHHALYDGVSVSNLFSEIVQLYNGKRLPSAVSFEPFLQVVLAQNGPEAIKFWSKQMKEFKPHPLPLHDATTTQQGEKTFERKILLKPAVVKAFSERHSCTSSVVFQAAWVKTLACVQDVTDVCFGNVVSGRAVDVPNVERLVAPCFNTIPLRTKMGEVRTNLDLIGHLQATNLETMPHQLSSVGRIQGLTLQPSRRLFESVLLVQPPKTDSDDAFTEVGEMDMGIPIVAEIIPGQDEFDLKFHVLVDRVPESIVSTLMDAFDAALASCVRYPSSSSDNFVDFDTVQIVGKLTAPPAPIEVNDRSDDGSDTTWSTEEQAIRDVFADLAGVDTSRISKRTSLYRIGLDSLNAVQVASKLRSKGLDVDAADVMQFQNPEALASFVGSRTTESEGSTGRQFDFEDFDVKHRSSILSAYDIEETMLEAVRPCTAAQSGMLSQFIQSSGQHYLNHTAYEVPTDYSFEAIRSAWVSVQRKHQVLRMGFSQLDEAAVPFAMVIYHAGSFLDQIISTSSACDQSELQCKAGEDILRNLQIPAWRIALIECHGKKQMHFTMHHSLYDADSLQILLADFAKALQASEIGPTTTIDKTLRAQVEGAMNQRDASEKFWKSSLQSAQ